MGLCIYVLILYRYSTGFEMIFFNNAITLHQLKSLLLYVYPYQRLLLEYKLYIFYDDGWNMVLLFFFTSIVYRNR